MPEQTTPAADWTWQDDPDVISWDWRQGPDLAELTTLLARHGVTLTEVDTGTDDVAIRIGAGASEPAAKPAESHQEPPADPDPHPDTHDAPGVLGRALLDRDGDVWPEKRGGGYGAFRQSVEWVNGAYGPVREVLLVDPAAADVLDAARWCRDADNDGLNDDFDAAARELHAAVDALTSRQDTPTDTDTDNPPPETASPQATAGGAVDTPADPEPAGDGPGWDRFNVDRIIEMLRVIPQGASGDADQVAALLADRDRLADASRVHNQLYQQSAAVNEQIRQELIEVKSDMVARIRERDRYRAERDKALRLVHMRDTEQAAHEGELGDMRAKLSAAEAEIDELRELTATCGCGDGNPETARTRELAEVQQHEIDRERDRQAWQRRAERAEAERDTELDSSTVTGGVLRHWVAEIRAGQRDVPGSQRG